MQAGVRMAHVLNLIADGWKPGQAEPDMPPGENNGGGDEAVEGARSYGTGVLAVLVILILLLAVALTIVLCLVRRKGVALGSLFSSSDAGASGYGGSDSMRSSLL